MWLQPFLHLTDHRIGQNHRRHPIAVRQIKAKDRHVVHLLNRIRGENDNVVTTVATALHRLKIISLRGINTTETGTATTDIDDQARTLTARHIGDPLLLEGDTGAG